MDDTTSVNTGYNRRRRFADSFKDKDYRGSFVEENIANGIPLQIRSLREREGWSQTELGRRCGKAQPVISKLEGLGYYGYTVRTLARIAAAFDVALIVRFAPFSEVLNHISELSGEDILVPRYDEDSRLDSLASVINLADSTAVAGKVESGPKVTASAMNASRPRSIGSITSPKDPSGTALGQAG